MPTMGEQLLGGHAILIRGWKNIGGKPYWIMVNSWGDTGDRGIYYYPMGAPIDEAWLMVEGELSPGPDPEHQEPIPVDPIKPSPCKVGGAAAKILNVVPWLLRRKGRMVYADLPNKD